MFRRTKLAYRIGFNTEGVLAFIFCYFADLKYETLLQAVSVYALGLHFRVYGLRFM